MVESNKITFLFLQLCGINLELFDLWIICVKIDCLPLFDKQIVDP